MAKCLGPINPLVMMRGRGFVGPFFQRVGGGQCVTSVGNAYSTGGPLSGVSAIRGVVVTETTIDIYFVPCVAVPNPSEQPGVELSINGGDWFGGLVASVQSPSVVRYVLFGQSISPGDDVKWRYQGLQQTLVDCDEGEEIGFQQLVTVTNDLVLAGDFVLMQSGGMDIVLVQEDPDGTEGVEVQEKP